MKFPTVPSQISHPLASHRTNLPIAVLGESAQIAPQYDPISWAMYKARTVIPHEPPTATLVLVAYAQMARAALFSNSGYRTTLMPEVANLLGVSLSTVRRYIKVCEKRGLLMPHADGYRVPEEALDGSWVVF